MTVFNLQWSNNKYGTFPNGSELKSWIYPLIFSDIMVVNLHGFYIHSVGRFILNYTLSSFSVDHDTAHSGLSGVIIIGI